MRARERIDPTAIFDPQRLAPRLPSGIRWSLVRGCQDPLTAMIRAKSLATAANFGGVSDAGFWAGKTTAAIQAMLHAAALDGRGARTLYQRALNPTAAGDAVRILSTNSGADDGWVDSHGRDGSSLPPHPGLHLARRVPRVSLSRRPRVLDAVSPGPDEEFDPESLLLENGTLYLLATGSGSGAVPASPACRSCNRWRRRGRSGAGTTHLRSGTLAS